MTGKELRCFQATINWVLLVKLAWFVGLRACKGWRRSVTFYDLVILFQAATGALLTMSMIQFLLGPLPAVPRSVFLLDWGATIVVLGGTRSLLCGFHEARTGRSFPRRARCGCSSPARARWECRCCA